MVNIFNTQCESVEEETLRGIRLKGVNMVYNTKTNEVFLPEDDELTTCIGIYISKHNSVSFFKTKESLTIIEEQLKNMTERYKSGQITANLKGLFISKFIVNGEIHYFNHEDNTFAEARTGEIIWVLNDEGELTYLQLVTI